MDVIAGWRGHCDRSLAILTVGSGLLGVGAAVSEPAGGEEGGCPGGDHGQLALAAGVVSFRVPSRRFAKRIVACCGPSVAVPACVASGPGSRRGLQVTKLGVPWQ